jgi:hypothetical protein
LPHLPRESRAESLAAKSFASRPPAASADEIIFKPDAVEAPRAAIERLPSAVDAW